MRPERPAAPAVTRTGAREPPWPAKEPTHDGYGPQRHAACTTAFVWSGLRYDFAPGMNREGAREMKKTTTAVVAAVAALALGSSALATMEIQKEYKAKDAKANCATCHVDKMP